MIELDHVLIAVDDYDAGMSRFLLDGLASYDGGRHPDWGTANRIVPLGESYIELITVADEAAARRTVFGRRVVGAARGRTLLGWAVRGDIERIAARLDLQVGSGSRQTADGRTLRWRFAGLEQAAAEPLLPFFIEWEPGTPLPGAGGTARLTRLELRGDAQRLDEWLGVHDLPIVVTPGEPAVTSFALQR